MLKRSRLLPLLLLLMVSCGGKYYSKTSNGIKVKADKPIWISVIDPEIIYISESDEKKFEKYKQFDVIESETDVSLATTKMTVKISVNDFSIEISNNKGKFLETDSTCILEKGKFILSDKGFGKYYAEDGYYILTGENINAVVSKYNKSVRKTSLIPKWALGHWQGISHDNSPIEVIKELRNRNFGIDNIVSTESGTDIDDIKKIHGHLANLDNTGSSDVYWSCDGNRSFSFNRDNCIMFDGLDWNSLEMSIKKMINYSIGSGPYNVSVMNEKITDPEIKQRWYQFSVFTPVFCTFSDCSINTYYNKLRYGMIPYIYSLCGNSYLKGDPIITPVLDDSGQILDQYMFGPSMMVCPVYQKTDKRTVQFPKGTIWYDYNHPNKIYEGGTTIIYDVTEDRIPVFVPGGAIIIYGQKNRYVGEIIKDDKVDLDIDIYAGSDNYFEIYDDDGNSNGYKNGEYSIVPVQYTESPRTIIIGTRKGKFPGMLQNRNVHVAVYDKGKMKAINVYYEGAKIKISL